MKKIYFKNIFDLKNKTIVLTGSAGRLGKNFSEILSSYGANVVLLDINEKDNLKIYNKIKIKYKTQPLAITCDLTKEQEIKNSVKSILKKYKKIDVLINNAYIFPRTNNQFSTKFENFPIDLWEKIASENLRSVFLCTKEFGKIMSKQKSGNIINVSSIYGILGPDQRIYGKSKLNAPSAYSTAKGGIVSFTKYLASYWNKKNIRVNTLTLGGVFDKKIHTDKKFVKNYSDKTIIGRMATPDDFDGAILFLTSDASRYVTGFNLIIDGGLSAW